MITKPKPKAKSANERKPQKGDKYKLGQELYEVFPDDDGKCSIDIWIVRTIRAGKATAINKVDHVTWVKLSKAHFDWGWAKTIDKLYRSTWPVDKEHQYFGKTKLEAWKKAKKRVAKWIEMSKEFGDEPDACDVKALATIERKIKELSK